MAIGTIRIVKSNAPQPLMTFFDRLGPAEGYDIGIVKINETQPLMTFFDCLGPAEGFDIGIVKINETQLTGDIL